MTPPPATISGRFADADRLDRPRQRSRVGRGARHVPDARREELLGPVERLGLHVLRQRKRHRAGLGRRGEDAHRGQRGRNQLLGTPDPVEVPRHRRERVVHRHVAARRHLELLQHRIGRMRREDVAGQQQHRQPVDRRERRAGDHVRRARPDRRGARQRAEPVPHPRIADGGVHHRLLVPRLVVGQEARGSGAAPARCPPRCRGRRSRSSRRRTACSTPSRSTTCAARNRTSACAVVSRKVREPGPEFMGPGSRAHPANVLGASSDAMRRTPR